MTNYKKVFLDLLMADADVLMANAEDLYETNEDFEFCPKCGNEF